MPTFVSVTYEDGGKAGSTAPVELVNSTTSLNVPPSALTGVIGVDVECTENEAGDYIVKLALAKQEPNPDFHLAVHAGSGAPAFIDGPFNHFALLPPMPGGFQGLDAELTQNDGHTNLVFRAR